MRRLATLFLRTFQVLNCSWFETSYPWKSKLFTFLFLPSFTTRTEHSFFFFFLVCEFFIAYMLISKINRRGKWLHLGIFPLHFKRRLYLSKQKQAFAVDIREPIFPEEAVASILRQSFPWFKIKSYLILKMLVTFHLKNEASWFCFSV